MNASIWIKNLGMTKDGKLVLGGSFFLTDTMGIPLMMLFDWAEKHDCVISIPHYFASAIAHGWTDEQAFDKIHETLVDTRNSTDFGRLKDACRIMFMTVAQTMPGQDAQAIGIQMCNMLETGKGFHFTS